MSVEWEDLRAVAGTAWECGWLGVLIILAAAVCLYGGRGWRYLRRRARRLPEHLPRPERQQVRPEKWDDLAA